jgi:hypothetical protein
MQKKTWTTPGITEHGKVIEQTKGFGGKYWEILNPKAASDIIVPDDD